MPGFELRGRQRERETLERLLRDVRGGRSRVLVLRGEIGAGKSVLLDHLAETATGCQVVRAAGVEPEADIAYASLQLLCSPLLGHLGRLPGPQRDALTTAFGLSGGKAPQPLLLGLAVLGLFAEAAIERPLVCLVDDVQWLDQMSELILTFVARRLDAESVALVFAARDTTDERVLRGLPELPVGGLPDAEARDLLASVVPGPIDGRVRDRIIAETAGNPLALLELPRGLTSTELAFGFGSPGLAGRVEDGFQRRIAALPDDARRLLLAAAVEPVGNVSLLWRALEVLGIDPSAAAEAEAAGLITVGTRVRFRHSLVRSAAWHSADAADLRAVHAALAEVTDPAQDPDRRAWHRAHAALGPDEQVATELEQSAGRALARGGRSAAATFLERAAELTLDLNRRASLLLAAAQARLQAGTPALVPDMLAAVEMTPLEPLQRAQVERLRAQLAFLLNPGRAAGPPLLAAAERLESLDPVAARNAYLTAVGAALHAGRLGGDDLRRAATSARRVEAGDDFPGMLLTGLTAWALDGYAEAQPALSRALAALTADEHLSLLWMAAPAAHELFELGTAYRITDRAVRYARETGTQSLLPIALSYRAGTLLFMGRFADAAGLLDEGQSLAQATGIAFPQFASLALVAFQGRAEPALKIIDSMTADARRRDEGRLLGLSEYARAVLYNGLGDFPAALAAARASISYQDMALYGWTLPELVEAAVRVGDETVAQDARERLAARADAARNAWSEGIWALGEALAGPPARAEERYRQSMERLSADGVSLLVARTRLLYGEWLRRENRRADARAELRTAYEAFAAFGAEAFAERAGRELTATGDAVPKRVAGPRQELTAQEAHIARLAVAGRTNPEIATAMFLSPRTVEWHLRKIFTKLGITSRRELATALP
ncbi:helix-turn-helix transcriptional regulator [Actinoplanes sp. CA-142083]|uniref:helix-turn-helix transcriptional regulator n=1 Tax=Actinoplanes sp. CA-142083 TaxID=3239903 RepID=UPI003D8D3036